jgi:hypothetical protein
MDFNFIPNSNDLSAAVTALIDVGLEKERAAQPRRPYLGGSRCGEECSRRLGYEFFNFTPDYEFDGQTLRRFQRGHDCETRMAKYLRQAGFDLLTEKQDGKQFGFAVARDPVTGNPRIAGHLDGVFVGGPDVCIQPGARLLYPALWENKGLNNAGVNKLRRNGLRAEYPVYYAQMQLYMAYMELTANPGLFTAENQDDCTIYAELIPFDLAAAQEASDRGVRVVSANDVNELPRIARDATDYRCRMCSFAATCWAAPTHVTINTPVPPAWLFKPQQ